MTDTAVRMREMLAALEPEAIDIRDDSARHVGHPGAREGGHYSLMVVSRRFTGVPTQSRHRMVYDALRPLMPGRIHALQLRTYAPDEIDRSQPQERRS